MSKKRSTISKKRSKIGNKKTRISKDSDTISASLRDLSKKKDGASGSVLTVDDVDGDITSHTVIQSPQKLQKVNIVDGSPGTIQIEGKAGQKDLAVFTGVSGGAVVSASEALKLKAMKDSDGRGKRGLDAESEVAYSFRNNKYKVTSEKQNDLLAVRENAEGNKFERLIEVKEINEVISEGNGSRRGRVQVEKKHIQELMTWEKQQRKKYPNNLYRAELYFKVNHQDGSITWHNADASDIWYKIRYKKSQTVNLPYKTVIGFDEVTNDFKG